MEGTTNSPMSALLSNSEMCSVEPVGGIIHSRYNRSVSPLLHKRNIRISLERVDSSEVRP